GTLVLSLLLLAYAAFASRRSGDEREPAPQDLGATAPPIFLEVREAAASRTVRAARGVLIGRSPSAAVRLADPTVSRLHARIERRGGTIYVEDLGSRNGTLLNGKPIAHEAPLSPGDAVRIGSTEIVFVGVGEWK
ncbi:MAG: FHA domain-containing protein, partial [Candidatus Eremiobacteraeota bacterium]|nr:FHA domain-containing protein [Candidatus Eremiobacteraeota bacterium]